MVYLRIAAESLRNSTRIVQGHILPTVPSVSTPLDFLPRREEICVFQDVETQFAGQC